MIINSFWSSKTTSQATPEDKHTSKFQQTTIQTPLWYSLCTTYTPTLNFYPVRLYNV